MSKKSLSECGREELLEIIRSLKKQKKFGLVWEDKPEKVAAECKKKLPVVKEDADKVISNADVTGPTNLIIEGDNYHTLSVLNYTHAGKIDVIYIDPPYNTGNKDFTYNDRYVDKEDSFKHSKWLSFMYKRLLLAKSLLSEKGIIFISIDDHEQANLKLLCDEIFGEENKLATIAIVNNLKGRSDDEFFATAHETLMVYARDVREAKILGLPMSESSSKEYKKFDSISRYKEVSLQKTGKNSRRIDRPKMYYPIYYNPKTTDFSLEMRDGYVEIFPALINGNEGCWRWGKKTFFKNKDTELVARQVNGIWRIYVKMRDIVDGEKRTTRPKTIWIDSKYDTGAGGKALKSTLGKSGLFSSPKPPEYLKDIIRIGARNNGVILDFFAGSGTTGQAVLELNKEDGGHRQFILCTNNENGIAEEVTYPRIKAVVEGYGNTKGILANVRYFKTDFVEKDETLDKLRRKLSPACEDMIRIREGAFDKVIDEDKFKVYRNSRGLTAVIFDRFELADYIAQIEELETDAPVHLYVFSYTNYGRPDELSDNLRHTYESQPIPEGVLEIYKRIFNKGGKR